jgi:hypothetical protein
MSCIEILVTKPARKPLALHGMNGSPERGGGTEAQVVGFKEAPPFGRGASLAKSRSVRPGAIQRVSEKRTAQVGVFSVRRRCPGLYRGSLRQNGVHIGPSLHRSTVRSHVSTGADNRTKAPYNFAPPKRNHDADTTAGSTRTHIPCPRVKTGRSCMRHLVPIAICGRPKTHVC